MEAKVQKWGNSLGVRIPKSFAREVDVRDGSTVDLCLDDGAIVLRPARRPSYSLEQLLQGVEDEHLHPEVDTGPPVGRERW